MKKFVSLTVLTIMIFTLFCLSFAQAEIIPAHGEGQIGLEAVVLCEKLTIRENADSSAKSVKTLQYGDRIIVMKQDNGWAEVILSDDVDTEPAGWVNASYLAIDPAWYKTEEKTPVYAWDDTSAPKVGLLDEDVTLPILKDEGDWLIVSLRGATGWIRVDDTGMLEF